MESQPAQEKDPLETRKHPNRLEIVQFGFLKLPVGTPFQIQLTNGSSERRLGVKLLGYREKKSLFVSAPEESGRVLLLREGQNVVIRFFSGKNAYAFDAAVLRVCHAPYPYLHLSCPATVHGIGVRTSERVKTNFSASVLIDGRTEPIPCIIADLSLTGALLDSTVPLSQVGHVISLSFQLTILETPIRLSHKAVVIRSVNAEGQPSGNTLIHHGIVFQELELIEQLTIQNYIYQQMFSPGA